MGMSGIRRLVRFRRDREFLSGSSNRTAHFGIRCLDVTTPPSEIPVLPVQDRISVGSGSGCVSRYLVGFTDHLTKKPPITELTTQSQSINAPCFPERNVRGARILTTFLLLNW